jgi:hypothetical protein
MGQVNPLMARLEADIESEHFFTARDGRDGALANGREIPQESNVDLEPLDYVMICVLIMKNGHTSSAAAYCAGPESYDRERAKQAARNGALSQMMPTMAYLARSRL